MNASEFPRWRGFRSSATAFSYEARSGPCALIALCRLAPPGTNPPSFASYTPRTSPMNSLITLRWKYGGRQVFSATIQRGGKITKSTLATPGVSDGEVSTVKIDGSGWSKVTVFIALKRARSYLYG